MEDISLSRLKLKTWRQIEHIDIQFHKRLTVITGANGAGKTTILNIIGSHFGWGAQYVGTPKRDSKKGILKWVSDFWDSLIKSESPFGTSDIIGEITYSNDKISNLSVATGSRVYSVSVDPQYPLKGLHIPSHRSVYNYMAVSQIPTQPILSEEAFSKYRNSVRDYYFGEKGYKPNFVIKETLLSLATFGYGNQVVVANPIAKHLFERFQEVLKLVFPPKLGFERIAVEMPEILLVTKSGEFTLDSASGGIASILDLVWQIFMFEIENKNFVVTIDEPENHLHPEMQQTLLKGLLDAFPNVQFVVATHNPFIITSVPDSNVYVLNYNDKNKVESQILDFVNKAGTANEVLRDVLGLQFTMPIWAEEELQKIIGKYSSIGVNEESLNGLRQELTKIGLENLVPNAIAEVVEAQQKND